MLNGLPRNPSPVRRRSNARVRSPPPPTAWHYRPRPPPLARRAASRTSSQTTRRNNIPHSSPAIRGSAQSGFNEVAPTHGEDLVRDLTEASRFGTHVGWIGGQHGWRSPFRWICGAERAAARVSWWGVFVRSGGAERQPVERGEVVATAARDGRLEPGKMGGQAGRRYRVSIAAWLRSAAGTGSPSRAGSGTGARGLKVDYRTVWEFVHAAGLSFKKNVLPAEQDRRDVARKRARWKASRAASIPPGSSSSTRPGPRPTWRRCAAGARAGSASMASVPHGHWQTLTFLAALRHDRVDARLGLRWADQWRDFPRSMSSRSWLPP